MREILGRSVVEEPYLKCSQSAFAKEFGITFGVPTGDANVIKVLPLRSVATN